MDETRCLKGIKKEESIGEADAKRIREFLGNLEAGKDGGDWANERSSSKTRS
jgi:hypothetical protein